MEWQIKKTNRGSTSHVAGTAGSVEKDQLAAEADWKIDI